MALDTVPPFDPNPASADVGLIIDSEHFLTVVRDGILQAKVSVAIATADFKAMLVPGGNERRAPSIVEGLARLAERGVEVRLLHAGVPSAAAITQLKKLTASPGSERLTIRRCPRVHMKAVIIDCTTMYLGSANLTGAGLGAKGPTRRNFEVGILTDSAHLIDGVLDQFNAVWEGKHCQACGRRDVCPVPLEEPDLRPAAD